MPEGAALAPSLLLGVLFLLFIALGECFCTVHVDNNCFKEYSDTVINHSLTNKYFLIYFRFPTFLSCLGLLLFLHCVVGSMLFFLELTVLDCKLFLKVGLILSFII